jgi:hypothetical protein
MAEKPEVGFQFGVEGDQSLLSTLQALRTELKNVQQQQQSTASSAEVLQRAWRGLVELAAALKLAEFAKDVFDTAVNLGKLSQITGVSTQTLSVYYKAATDVGVAHEAVDKGVTKLARSLVLLQAGNGAAASGFRLLHLSAKDFIGLSPDEKLRKVTDAFALMKDGPEKAAAAIALFGKAGAQLIPVLDQLGGEEFAKVREQAERLGLVFTQEMAEGALRAKAALADLKGLAEGVTAQFETGLLPAVADAADGVVAFALETDKANKSGENSFKQLGEAVGWAIKAIILILAAAGTTLKDFFLAVGVALETIGREVINIAATDARAMLAIAEGDYKTAWNVIKNGGIEAANGVKDAWNAVGDSVKHSNERFMALFSAEFAPDTVRKLPKPGTGEPGDIKGSELDSSKLDRSRESALKQQAQDELTLYRDLSRQKQEQDKRDYDAGLISLENYFGRRRNAITDAFVKEITSLGTEKLALQDLLAKAESEGGKTPQQQLANQREIMQLKQQIAHVDAEIVDESVKRDIDLAKVEDERARAKQDHLLKELEAQKKLSDLEGDRVKSAQLASQIEDLQLRKELEQLGKTKAEIDAFLAEFDTARAVRSGGEVAKQDFSGELSDFEARKAAIEAQAEAGPLAGGIPQFQAERELKALYEQEIPLLEIKIDKLRQQAQLAQAGSDLQKQLVKEADDETRKIEKLRQEMAKLANQWKGELDKDVKQVSQDVTHGFNGWIQGQETFGRAAQKVWNNILLTAINSIENIAAKWIEQHILMAAVSKALKLVGLGGGDSSQMEQKSAQATGSIQIDAATAAADVFAQAISQIPFPANLAAAPALAAATEAQVMAFQAQAAAGGAAGVAGGAGFAAGGYVSRRMLGSGGYLRGPGSSTSDSIPALLSDREYVVSAKGVSSVGVDTLDMINRGALRGAFLPPIRHPAPYTAHGFSAYAGGGAVRNLRPSSSGGEGTTIHNHNQVVSNSIDSRDFRDHIDDHMDYISDALQMRMRNFRWPRH